ncbi:hypothetical protein [Gottschalkia acidurici]|nr:hypothetical protein [Gottschalkia acidurici]
MKNMKSKWMLIEKNCFIKSTEGRIIIDSNPCNGDVLINLKKE